MNTSFATIARANRLLALDALRRKTQTKETNSDVLCLQTMRQKLQSPPVFVSARAHRFEERLAA